MSHAQSLLSGGETSRARNALVSVLGRQQDLHLPGVRDRWRSELHQAIVGARTALAVVESQFVPGERRSLSLLLVRALAARAEDARYGAGQLSRSAQRAPTEADCEAGWQRVRGIIATAQVAADEAERVAESLEVESARNAAKSARQAAERASAIQKERNHAYTFHTDPRFSFGEGWYLAAAAVLSGVTIQVEPDQPHTSRARTFLREAGLGPRIVAYRARPRANKALPEIVARAFVQDPQGAQERVRKAFLGSNPIGGELAHWADRALKTATLSKKVLLWVRQGSHHVDRNTNHAEFFRLCELAWQRGLQPIAIGDALPGELPPKTIDLTLFWKLPMFTTDFARKAQLQLFEYLRSAHGLVGQVGVTTAGMDGPALLGLPTMYITDAPNVRLGKWVGAVPGYREIVRSEGYLDDLAQGLSAWSKED